MAVDRVEELLQKVQNLLEEFNSRAKANQGVAK